MSGRSSSVWLAAGVVVAGALAWLVTGDVPPPVGRGSPAPAFELPRVGGGAPVSLDSLRGRLVLLNFWATWCKPCEDELPAMERLHRALAGTDFELVAISVDADEEPVIGFRDRIGLGFTLLLDSDQGVARRYQTFRFPETLLIGRDGVILERYVGSKEWDSPAYLDRIRQLLAAPADTGS